MPGEPVVWSEAVLESVTTRLRTSTVTEARGVELRHAWADGPLAACLVYRLHQGPWLGLRRHSDDARRAILEADEGWPDGMTIGYDMHDEQVLAGQLPDPERFAWNVVDFDLGEPAEPQDGWPRDEEGTAWRGRLEGTRPPRRPTS